jgi:hypothetical protein
MPNHKGTYFKVEIPKSQQPGPLGFSCEFEAVENAGN